MRGAPVSLRGAKRRSNPSPFTPHAHREDRRRQNPQCHCEQRKRRSNPSPFYPHKRTARNGAAASPPCHREERRRQNPQCHCEPQSGEAIRPPRTLTYTPRGTETPQALHATARNGDVKTHNVIASRKAAKQSVPLVPPHIHTRAETPKPFPPAFFTQTPCLSPPGPSPPTSPGYWGFSRWYDSPS